MILFRTILPLQAKIAQLKKARKSIGFVPTMGALHSGHISLIEASRLESDITVCSIFINPMQFNDKKDFEKYPKNIEQDILLLEQNGADIIFMPSVDEIYPTTITTVPNYNLDYLENILEGFYRPGHFQGVCRVVERLLHIVMPDILFLGQKDYQQCMVIKKMMNQANIVTQLKICPTHREDSGLAMSSRNIRLSTSSKVHAAGIYKALEYVKDHFSQTSLSDLKNTAIAIIKDSGFEKVDYVEICDGETLLAISEIQPQKKYVVLAAAFIDGIRLIDNLLLN